MHDRNGIEQPLIPYVCASEFTCTTLGNPDDGRIVAYEPTTETPVVYDSLGLNELLRVSLAEPLVDA